MLVVTKGPVATAGSISNFLNIRGINEPTVTASNIDANVTQFNATTYGKMLANTPHAFLHLLNSCIYTRGIASNVATIKLFSWIN